MDDRNSKAATFKWIFCHIEIPILFTWYLGYENLQNITKFKLLLLLNVPINKKFYLSSQIVATVRPSALSSYIPVHHRHASYNEYTLVNLESIFSDLHSYFAIKLRSLGRRINHLISSGIWPQLSREFILFVHIFRKKFILQSLFSHSNIFH